MYKRQISLYFGSISIRRSFQGIGLWFAGFWMNADAQRSQLHQKIKEIYSPSSAGVFSVGSGRSALALCLKAAGIGSGDEVLLSAYTCLAVPTAVIAAGAKPVYVDIDEETLNVDPSTVFAALSPRVRAIVVQHTLGKPAQVQAIVDEARERGILVIEDCALALGSKINTHYIGTFADAAILSMELSKTLSVGWGGILLVNNDQLAKNVTEVYKHLQEPSWWSATRDLWQTVISSWCYQPRMPYWIQKYVMYAGFKSRMFRPSTPKSEFEGFVGANFLAKMGGLQAALAIRQWNEFAKIVSMCERNAEILRTALLKLNIITPGAPAYNEVSVAPRVSLLVSDRDLAVRYFGERGIELGQWFDGPLSPIPTSPLFNYQVGAYPAAEKVADKIVNLPCHSRLTEEDLRHMCGLLDKFSQEYPECVLGSVDNSSQNADVPRINPRINHEDGTSVSV